jgi:hypothetical protein
MIATLPCNFLRPVGRAGGAGNKDWYSFGSKQQKQCFLRVVLDAPRRDTRQYCLAAYGARFRLSAAMLPLPFHTSASLFSQVEFNALFACLSSTRSLCVFRPHVAAVSSFVFVVLTDCVLVASPAELPARKLDERQQTAG